MLCICFLLSEKCIPPVLCVPVFESAVLKMLKVNCKYISTFYISSFIRRYGMSASHRKTQARSCLKSFNIIHNILHWGNNTSGFSNANEENKRNRMQLSRLCFFFLHFERVNLKQRPPTAQEYWCGVEQPCPPKHSDSLPVLVLLHGKHKTASVLNSGFGLMTVLSRPAEISFLVLLRFLLT